MRGPGDQLSIGERIAFYRRRRGYTQRVLANLVSRSEDWLSKIERNERDIRRLDVLMEDPQPSNDDVPAVRAALMSHRRLSQKLFGTAVAGEVNPTQVAKLSEFAWQDYQAGRLGRVIASLPGLIRSAQALHDTDPSSENLQISARIHHLAATALSKIGEADLAWIAAERAMAAAETSGDPLSLASASRAGTHALLAVGRYTDAVQLGQTAADCLEVETRHSSDPVALSLIGMLRLRTAVATARHYDRPQTMDFLERAEHAATTLGRDANYWQTSFGPTNVQLHRVSTSLDLEDVQEVIDHGPMIDTDEIPVERTVSHKIDLARANAYAARDEDSLAYLLDAETQAPELVRHNAAVRETVKALHRRARRNTSQDSALLKLATRCRAIA